MELSETYTAYVFNAQSTLVIVSKIDHYRSGGYAVPQVTHINATAASMVRLHGNDAIIQCEAMIAKLGKRHPADLGLWPDILIAIRMLQPPAQPPEANEPRT
jgi:hypothetical protein